MLPRLEDVAEFRLSLTEESDRGCALMAGAFLDSELEALLRSAMVANEDVADEILGQSRPAGTFSARIDLAYLLGLIDPVTRRDLHLIRKIRNDFGHLHRPIAFDDDAITSRVRELKLNFREAEASTRAVFCSCAVAALAVIHAAMRGRERLEERPAPDMSKVRARRETLEKGVGLRS